jgi:hypothetical protein
MSKIFTFHNWWKGNWLFPARVWDPQQLTLIINGQKTKCLRCTRKNYDLEELHINSMYLEQVQSYKYLGSVVNSDNSIEEIRHRITLGNKAYYANQFLIRSRLVCKKSKLKFYWSVIRPIVTCLWNMGFKRNSKKTN